MRNRLLFDGPPEGGASAAIRSGTKGGSVRGRGADLSLASASSVPLLHGERGGVPLDDDGDHYAATGEDMRFRTFEQLPPPPTEDHHDDVADNPDESDSEEWRTVGAPVDPTTVSLINQ